MQQPLLFAKGDAGGRAAEGVVAAVAHFDEHPGGAVAHDEVELTAAHRDVGGAEGEPGVFQVTAGQ